MVIGCWQLESKGDLETSTSPDLICLTTCGFGEASIWDAINTREYARQLCPAQFVWPLQRSGPNSSPNASAPGRDTPRVATTGTQRLISTRAVRAPRRCQARR